jgi:adhesin/invasin
VANFTQADTAGTTAGSANVFNLNSGSSINVVIDDFGYFTGVTNGVVVSATPSTVSTGQTGGVNDSSVVATVLNAGSPVVGDTVAVATTASTAGSCGTIPATGTTGAGGKVTLAYVGTAVVGTCTIKVTEAASGLSGTTVITQAANNSVTVATGGTAIAPHTVIESVGTLVPNVVSATVTTPTNTPVVGETVNFTLTPLTTGGCGTLTAPSEVTSGTGVATDNYNSPFVTGLCLITATEATAQTGESAPQSGTTYYNSTSPTGTAALTVAFTPAAANVAENTPATVTVTVAGAAAAPIPNDPVFLTVAAGSSTSCGTLNTASGVTNASGVATFTYTAGSATGTCTITGVESHNNVTSATPETITQTANNSVAIGASTNSVVANGTATSTITATVTSSTGSPVTGDVVTFVGTPTPAGSCGTFTPAAAGATNSSGVVTVTYTASTTSGFCSIAATEGGTGQAATTVIDQT